MLPAALVQAHHLHYWTCNVPLFNQHILRLHAPMQRAVSSEWQQAQFHLQPFARFAAPSSARHGVRKLKSAVRVASMS